jgi:hypothetical protein
LKLDHPANKHCLHAVQYASIRLTARIGSEYYALWIAIFTVSANFCVYLKTGPAKYLLVNIQERRSGIGNNRPVSIGEWDLDPH